MRNMPFSGLTPSSGTMMVIFVVLLAVILEITTCSWRQPIEPVVSESTIDSSQANRQANDTGKELYTRHCAACHGTNGNGQGIAASYLFPKPRDFRSGRFRLVSTANNVPLREDLEAVLARGMPGSSMPPWEQLPEKQRSALVNEVLGLWQQGIRDRETAFLKDEEGFTAGEILGQDVQQQITDHVKRVTTPGATTKVPALGSADSASIERGRAAYLRLGCHACHGKDGKGDGVEKQFDDEGFPTRPRDYTRGIFKGGHDAASLFRRIAYGMPGTPMPGASKATPQERGDLVHFIRSLSDEATREDAVIKRRQLIVQRVKRVPGNEPRDWAGIVPADLQMIPLWWRDNADPGLQIQAVHDGQTIAIRLCWHDKTDDHEAVKGDSFEDAVAVALYHGNAEPFIGMGAPEAPVDIWFWDADRQTATVIEEAYPNMVVDRYPLSESTVDTAAFDRPGTRTTSQPPISLPAHASGNPIAPAAPGSGSSSLSAAGPGTVAFQNPRGRVIQARGHWQNGRWSILLARSLQPGSPADRVILEPGRRVSVAIAIWDGSQRERNGKKLVTIWNDLELEK